MNRLQNKSDQLNQAIRAALLKWQADDTTITEIVNHSLKNARHTPAHLDDTSMFLWETVSNTAQVFFTHPFEDGGQESKPVWITYSATIRYNADESRFEIIKMEVNKE